MHHKRHLLYFALGLTLTVTHLCFAAEPYNEVINPKTKRLRQAYAQFQKQIGRKLFQIEPSIFNQLMGRPLGDTNKIFPIPLLLPKSDKKLIEKGAQQIARTFSALYEDIILNSGKMLRKSGLMSSYQLQAVYRAYLPDYNSSFLKGIWSYRKNKKPRLLLGPDLVRGSDGQFYVLEVNQGNLGGIGDFSKIQKTFNQAYNLNLDERSEFIVDEIYRFLSDLPLEKWNTDVVAILSEDQKQNADFSLRSDDEDQRIKKIISGLGITIYTPRDLNNPEVTNRLMLHTKKIINLNDIARYRLHETVLGCLLAQFAQNNLDFFVSPGVELFESKFWLVFLDKLIPIYLGEEPLLKVPLTFPIVKPQLIEKFKSLSNTAGSPDWVIKETHSSRGKGIYFLSEMSD